MKVDLLGVHLNKSFTWHDHVNETFKQASKRLRILRVLKPFVSHEELHQVYVASVRSVFDYACALLVGLDIGLSKKLQRIDKRAHRMYVQRSTLVFLRTRFSEEKTRTPVP